jgi:uncharacterized protein (UPF0332 family)
VTADVEALLRKARRSLENARRSFAADDFDFAASRAYYAMFYAAEALLLSRGLSFSKHSAVIAEVNRVFVRAGELPEAHAAALRDALEQRQIADYHFQDPFPARIAAEVIERAESFLRDAGAYLARGTA